MPSRKRVYQEANGEEVEILQSASSNLRKEASTNKRLRVDGRPVRNSTASRETSLEIESGDVPSTQFQRQTVSFRDQYEQERDREIDDATDEDIEAEVADYQEKHMKTRPPGAETGNRAAENGILESVVCTNFMCHSKLSVTFGPLINFIIGHNGSGKSAVLTAIQLCLGGKATSTNRGQSLKAFIKEGQESATLSVKIKNHGDNAFKKDIYGRSILVERTFTMKGTSGFKIRSVDGRIMSTKRAEVDEINDFYALQLDNPVNVLTQDMARQFLNSSSPSDKYKFLVKGVLLEQLDRDYLIVAENLDNLEGQMANAAENCTIFKEKYDEAERKRELIEQHSSLRDKIRMYSRQLAWIQVEEQEKELAEKQKDIDSAQQKIESCEQSAEKYKAAFEKSERDLEQAQRTRGELNEELAPYTERRQEAQGAVDTAKEELAHVQSDARQAYDSMQNSKQQVQKWQEAIDDEMRRLEEVNGGAETSKRAEIVERDDKRKELQEELTRVKEEVIPDLERQKSEGSEKLKKFEGAQYGKRKEFDEAKKMLHALKQDQGNQNRAFDRSLPKLQEAIAREGRFKERPIGPMGLHVRLLKPQWSSIIEKTLGGSLDQFVVTSSQDQKILKEVMDKINYPSSGIVIGNKQRLNTSGKESDPKFDTILRVLEMDNDLVRNQLIILHMIEQTILVQYEDALHIMTTERPSNMAACLCPNNKKANEGIRFAYGRGNSQKQDPIFPWNGFTRMRTDVEAQIRNKEDIVSRIRTELGDIERRKSECQKSVTEVTQQIVQKKKQVTSLARQIQSETQDIERLNDEIQQLNPQEGTLEGHKENLNEAQEEFAHYQQQMEEINEKQAELSERVGELEEELQKATEQLESKNREIEKAAKKIRKLEEKRSDKLRDKNEAISRIEDAKADKAYAEANYEDQQKTIDEFVGYATEISERIPVDVGETHESLSRKVEKFNADLKRYEEEVGGDKETITRLAFEAREEHFEAERNFKRLVRLSEAFAQALRERRKRWQQFRSAISARARTEFKELMKRRGMYGDMVIDHNAKQLELQVDPDPSNVKRNRKSGETQGRQTRTLSGGEKSFSTICMLLALWEAMGSPIRCLDEFDVFMDSVYRDQSMRMLIDAARDNVGRQFVLITPQAMGSAELGTDVKVIRLSDPERGQTTLNIPGA